MKSIQRRDAGNHTRTATRGTKSTKDLLMPFVPFVAHVAGEQMRHGLKPCDTASDPVENPTRFLVEM